MSLRIRQIVVAARDLEKTINQFTRVLGVRECYRDPGVGEFGLANAIMVIGNQFLEVVSPIQENTSAGRHIERHGDSAYMLLLQTDDLDRDRARLDSLGVRRIWESARSDIAAFHLHPKDIGAAIVSLDQPTVPESWPWAGPNWQACSDNKGAVRINSVTIGAVEQGTMAKRWAQALGCEAPAGQGDGYRIGLSSGNLLFKPATTDLMTEFGVEVSEPNESLRVAKELGLPITDNAVTLGGSQFSLSATD